MSEGCGAEGWQVKASRLARRDLVTPKRDILDGQRARFWLIIRKIGSVSSRIGNVNVSSQQRKRIVAAWVCLFAAVALYAPLAGAAWSAHAINCCTGDYCPIPGHHHHKNQASPHGDMACGHDSGAMICCPMSCG